MRNFTAIVLMLLSCFLWVSVLIATLSFLGSAIFGGIGGGGGGSANSQTLGIVFTVPLALVVTILSIFYKSTRGGENLLRDIAILLSIPSYFYLLPFLLSMPQRNQALNLIKDDKTAQNFQWTDSVRIIEPGRCDDLCANLLLNAQVKSVIRKTNYSGKGRLNDDLVYSVITAENCSKPIAGGVHTRLTVKAFALVGQCVISRPFSGRPYARTQVSVKNESAQNQNAQTDRIEYIQYKIIQNGVVAQKTDYLYRVHMYPFITPATLPVKSGLARPGYGVYIGNLRARRAGRYPVVWKNSFAAVLEMTQDLDVTDWLNFEAMSYGEREQYLENRKAQIKSYEAKRPDKSVIFDYALRQFHNIKTDHLPLRSTHREQLRILTRYLDTEKDTESPLRQDVQIALLGYSILALNHCAEVSDEIPKTCSGMIMDIPMTKSFLVKDVAPDPRVKAALQTYYTALERYMYSASNRDAYYFNRDVLKSAVEWQQSLVNPDMKLNNMLWSVCIDAPEISSCSKIIDRYSLVDRRYLNSLFAGIRSFPANRPRYSGPEHKLESYYSALHYFPSEVLRDRFDELSEVICMHYTPEGKVGVLKTTPRLLKKIGQSQDLKSLNCRE